MIRKHPSTAKMLQRKASRSAFLTPASALAEKSVNKGAVSPRGIQRTPSPPPDHSPTKADAVLEPIEMPAPQRTAVPRLLKTQVRPAHA